MNKSIRFVAWLVGLLACVASSPAQAQPTAPPPVPLEAFFSDASMQSAKLSPSGRWLGVIVAAKGARARLVLLDLQGTEKPRVLAAFNGEDVSWFRWLNEEVLLFSVSDRTERSGRYRYPGLVSVTRDGERMRLLIKRDFDTMYPPPGGAQPLEANHHFLAAGAPGTDEVIVSEVILGVVDDDNTSRPLVLNARTGERRSLLKSQPPDVRDWVFDQQGRARVGIAVKDGRTRFLWHELKTAEWREIGNFAALDAAYWPRAVDATDRLYVEVSGGPEGSSELRRLDTTTGQVSTEMLANTPGFDAPIGLIQDEVTGEAVGYAVLTDARATVWLTPEMQGIQAQADALLPGRVNLLSCRRCVRPEAVLVHSSSDRFPGEYLVYRTQTKQWQRIGPQRPVIEPQRMAGLEFHRTKARDGADLPM